LRGKVLKVERARIDTILGNEEIRTIITAIGAGIKDDFNIENARYHKLILMTDAEGDGGYSAHESHACDRWSISLSGLVRGQVSRNLTARFG
jgi:hypothetical protein